MERVRVKEIPFAFLNIHLQPICDIKITNLLSCRLRLILRLTICGPQKSRKFPSSINNFFLTDASPFEKDSGRGFTAKQWAYLCGRKFCGDSLGELTKNRKALPITSIKKDKNAGRYAIPSKSSGPRTDGITKFFPKELSTQVTVSFSSFAAGLATKLRNIIPFYRTKIVSENDLPDLILETDKMNLVPTVEVTPANNTQLIKKYKNRYAAEKSVALDDEFKQAIIPKVPLRRKSSNE